MSLFLYNPSSRVADNHIVHSTVRATIGGEFYMAAPRAAAAAAGAGGVGMLFHSWFVGDTAPANLPSHPHHHLGYADAVGMKQLREKDIASEAPRNTNNSAYSMLESYVGPAGEMQRF
jgi:hypothetical protein